MIKEEKIKEAGRNLKNVVRTILLSLGLNFIYILMSMSTTKLGSILFVLPGIGIILCAKALHDLYDAGNCLEKSSQE